jgi:AraC-like DNA-binding protein
MIYFIGITISIFLFILLLLKRKKMYSDKILMVWMAVMALHQFLFYTVYSGLIEQYPHLIGFGLPLPVLHGPFLFFYVTSVTRTKTFPFSKMLPHFIPYLILVLAAVPFYFLSAEEKLNVFQNHGKGYEWYSTLQFILIMATGLGYVIWSLVLIHRHRSNVEQWFSNTEKRNLQWLEYLSILLGMIWLLVPFFDDKVIFTGVAILVLFIGFFGINQLPIFYSWHEPGGNTTPDNLSTPPAESSEPTDPEVMSMRYAKSGLKEEEAKVLHEQLTHLMEKEALFKKNDLTLSDLATRLNTHPNYLSQVINEKEQMNFYNYINTWRVKGFLQNAGKTELKHYTLLALAYDCGFNSKSTFNKYFKEFTGKPPSEYFSA